MKKTTTLAMFTFLAMPLAQSACKDPNFEGVEAYTYQDLTKEERFGGFQTFASPEPAALFEAYFGYSSDGICHDMMATYFRHKSSGKNYVMFTTHDDYCDGGNTYGIVVDMAAYQEMKLAESVVGEIGDSEFYCVD